MAYVEWHGTIPNHYKTKRLARILGCEKALAVGYLGCLVAWAIEVRPGGRFDRVLVAEGAEFQGPPDKIAAAMLEAGWLDEIDGSEVEIHDWEEVTRGYRKARKDAARRKRGSSAAKARQKRGSSAVTAPLPPRPDPTRTEQTRTEQNGSEGARAPGFIDDVELALKSNGGAMRSGSPAALVADAYRRTNPAVIAATKAVALVEFALARGAKADALEAAMMDPKAKGRKIWEILDEHVPKDKANKRGWQGEVDDWLQSMKTGGGNGTQR